MHFLRRSLAKLFQNGNEGGEGGVVLPLSTAKEPRWGSSEETVCAQLCAYGVLTITRVCAAAGLPNRHSSSAYAPNDATAVFSSSNTSKTVYSLVICMRSWTRLVRFISFRAPPRFFTEV